MLFIAKKKSFIIDKSGGNPSKSTNKGHLLWTRLHEKIHLDNGFHQLILNYLSLFSFNEYIAWVAGGDTILKTQDSGKTWKLIQIPSSNEATSVALI